MKCCTKQLVLEFLCAPQPRHKMTLGHPDVIDGCTLATGSKPVHISVWRPVSRCASFYSASQPLQPGERALGPGQPDGRPGFVPPHPDLGAFHFVFLLFPGRLRAVSLQPASAALPAVLSLPLQPVTATALLRWATAALKHTWLSHCSSCHTENTGFPDLGIYMRAELHFILSYSKSQCVSHRGKIDLTHQRVKLMLHCDAQLIPLFLFPLKFHRDRSAMRSAVDAAVIST